MKRLNRWKLSLVMLAVIGGLAHAALGGTYFWSGNGATLGGSGTWDNALLRWSTTAAAPWVAWPNGGGDEAVFTNTGTAGTVTLSGTINASKLTMLTNGYSLTGGTLNLGSGTAVISTTNFAVNANNNIYSPITGSGTLTLLGKASYNYGTFLAASNGAFTGKIVVDQLGSYFGLVVTNDNALGAVPANYVADALTLRNGAFLISGSSTPLTIAANRGITVTNGTTIYGNKFVLNCPVVNTPVVGTAGNVSFRNTTATLNSALNNYAGDTWPDNSTLIMGVDNGLPHGAGKGNLNFSDFDGVSTVNFNGHTLTINGLSSRNTTGNFLLSKIDNTNASAATLVLGDNNANGNTFVGIITNSLGALSLTKIGTGTQTLSGKSYYSGGTTVNGGTLQISGQSAPISGTGSGLVTINSGGTLSGAGYIAGGVTVASAASAVLYPNAGGQMVLGGNLTVGANATVKLNLGSNGLSGNDQVLLQNQTITGNNATITINPVSGLLDQTNDYVLLDAGASGTIASGFNPVPAWVGAAPWWAANCSILTVGNQVRLHCSNIGDVKFLLDFGGNRDVRDWYLLGVLQGLVNRDKPRLFITHNEIEMPGAGNLWPQWFQSAKGYSFVTLPSLGEAINLFKTMNGTNGQPLIQGLVKYQDVIWNPAITNYNDTYYQYWVAANYAAQENLLPVCADTLANNTTALSAGSYWYVDTMTGGWARMFASASYTVDGLAVTASTDANTVANMNSYWYKWVNVDLTVTPKIEITVSALSPGGQWGFAIDLGSTVNLYPNTGVTPLYTNMTGVGVFTFDLKNSGLFNPLTGCAGLHICAMTTNTTVTVRQIRFLTASNTVPSTMFYTRPTSEFNGLSIMRDLTDANAYPQLADEATACAWAVQNQLPLCNSNATLLLPNSYSSMPDLDVAIANRSFIFNQNSITQPFAQPSVNYSNILTSLVPPARVTGWQSWGEDYMIAYYARFGARQSDGGICNMSFWERVPSAGLKLPQNRQVTKLEPKFYVNFTYASGDALGLGAQGFFLGWWFDPMRGQMPNTWGCNTVLAETAPAFMEYFASTATPQDSFFAGPNGAGYAHHYDMTPAQAALYAHQTRVNIDAMGLTPAVDWAWGKAHFTQTNTDNSPPIGLFTPWNWQSKKNAHTDWLDDGTPVVYPESVLTGSKQGGGGTTPTSMASNILAVVSAHPEGGPFFITCNTRFSPTFYSQVMAQLNPDMIQLVGMQDFLNLAQEAGGFTVIPQARNVGAGDTLQMSIELHNADGTMGAAGTNSWILPSGWSASEPQWVHGTVPQRGVLKHIVTFTTPPVSVSNASPATLVFQDSRVSWVRSVTVTNCPSGQTISDCSSTNGWTVSSGASMTVTNSVGLTNGLIHLVPAVVQRRSDYLFGSHPNNGNAKISLGQVDFSRHPVLEVNLPVSAMSYNMSQSTTIKVINGSGSSKQLDSFPESKLDVLDLAALTGWTGTQTVTLEIDPCTIYGDALDVGDVRLYYYGFASSTNSTSLISPLQSQDIGLVGVAGASAFSNGVYTVQGGGASLTVTNDAFQFVYATLSGDGTIIARVASQQNTAAGAEAGVMMRQSLSPGAPETSVVLTPGSGVLFQSRTVTNGSTSVSQIAGKTAPYWVKLTRSGSLFTAYYSATGSGWLQLGAPQTVVMSDPIYVGLVVCSYNAASLNTSTFDNVSFPGQNLQPTPPTNVVAIAGNGQVGLFWSASTWASGYNVKRATASNGSYTVLASNLTTLSFNDTAATNGTTWYYVVSALGATGLEGANSSPVSAQPTGVPPAPSGLAAAAANTQLTLSWNAVASAVGYNLKRATASGGPYVPVGQYLGSTTFTDTALNNGTNYYYVVSAVNRSGEGANSAEVQAQPTLVATTPPVISAAVLGSNLTLSWPADHIGWRLQAQSNGLASTNWTDITGSENTNIWSLTIDRSAGTNRFYRLVYP